MIRQQWSSSWRRNGRNAWSTVGYVVSRLGVGTGVVRGLNSTQRLEPGQGDGRNSGGPTEAIEVMGAVKFRGGRKGPTKVETEN